jgi:hypothetical protein
MPVVDPTIVELVEAQRAAQGLPPRVVDRHTLDRIVEILRSVKPTASRGDEAT